MLRATSEARRVSLAELTPHKLNFWPRNSPTHESNYARCSTLGNDACNRRAPVFHPQLPPFGQLFLLHDIHMRPARIRLQAHRAVSQSVKSFTGCATQRERVCAMSRNGRFRYPMMVASKLEVLHLMLSILANGTLIADPVEHRSANDKPYATCTMRVPCDDGELMYVSVISFNADAVAALLALRRGDACAIAGRAKLTSWETGGVERHGLSVVAVRVL